MGPLHGGALIVKTLSSVLASYACIYGLMVEGPGDALLPFVTLQGWNLLWFMAAVFVTEQCIGLDKATVLQHFAPIILLVLVFVYWYLMDGTPHELLPSGFYESNEFRLFGRNFTVHKPINEGDNEAEVRNIAIHTNETLCTAGS